MKKTAIQTKRTKLRGYKNKGESRWLEEFPPFNPSESIAEMLSQLAGSKDYKEPSKFLRGLCGVIDRARNLKVINFAQYIRLKRVTDSQVNKLQDWLKRAGVDLLDASSMHTCYVAYLVALYHKHCETPGMEWLWRDGNLEDHVSYFRTSGMGTKYWRRVASKIRTGNRKTSTNSHNLERN